MGLVNGNKLVEGSRSHVGGLIISGHNSPAQRWILDKVYNDASMKGVFQDGCLFIYTAAGTTRQNVVIPMGRIVGVNLPQQDYVTTKLLPTIDLPGLSAGNNSIGVVPYNIYRDDSQQDRMTNGNYPSIITNNFIKVPMLQGFKPATMDKAGLLKEEKEISIDNKMPWGAAIGEILREGDYVKATASGRFTKWDKSKDSVVDIVGQVLGTDYNFIQSGWFQWMLYDQNILSNNKLSGDDSVINRSGSSDFPDSEGGWPYDPNYADGDTELQQYQQQYITNPHGMPGLHDGTGNYTGYGANDTEYADVAQCTAPAGCKDGDKFSFNISGYVGEHITNLQAGTVIKIDGTEVDPSRLVIDNLNGSVTVTLATTDAGKDITATFKAFKYGSDSYLDFKNAIGAVNILLKF